MTTQVKSIFNLSRLQSILDQLTTYTIVCFGIFQIDENHIKVVKKLQQRFTKIKKFEDYKLCEEYIKTNLSNLNDLIKKLTKDQQILLRKDETSRPNIYNRSKRDFFLIYEQRNAEFLYFQLFLGSLMKMSYDDIRAKQKLIDPWRIHCSNNTEQEKNNCNFETSYNPMQDVYWYSTEMFFYSILNKAFRDQNIDTLFAMRYFILNLTHQLADQHLKAYRIVPSNHEDLSKLYTIVADIYQGNNQFELAGKYYQKALDSTSVYFSENHVEIAVVYTNFGALYSKLGGNAEALDYYFKAREIFLRSSLKGHKNFVELEEEMKAKTEAIVDKFFESYDKKRRKK
ncbi:unnamed protein product [Rotaria sp. Silwood2]|nr:unnamed protein product [Rotaria sp. Silwood2]CAF4418040.1 unnamed protein product [Rotaria sp. Silwood2]